MGFRTCGGMRVLIEFMGGGCNIETVVAICELNELDDKSWGEMTFPFHLLYSILLEGSVRVVWCPLSLYFLFHQGESSEGFFE